MTAEWNRNAISNLIQEYKKHSHLYDAKHILYYNKRARTQSLKKIAEYISQARPGTTIEETHKKIQTLRTQIGQEIAKIERSREHGDDSLIYKPKVWWYESFEWVAAFMKGRSDPTTPLSVKLESGSSTTINQSTKTDLFNECDESAQETTEIEIEEEMIVQEPPEKRPRKSYSSSKNSNYTTPVAVPRQTIQYIISHDDTNAEPIINDQILEIQPDNTPSKETDRYKKRSKGFGKYVASLMQDIKDDKIFFETQAEILKIIEKATLKSSK